MGAPLDVFVVRKLGVPGHEEIAMGAIASGGIVVLNDDVVRGLNIAPEVFQRVAEAEARELLRREQVYREGRPMVDTAGKTVILVDDGLATGASMRAAIHALRRHKPAAMVVAVPAAPESTCRDLAAQVDEVVCGTTPSPFVAVGASYWDFTQTTEEEVRDLLRAASTTRLAPTDVHGQTDVAVIRSERTPVEDGVPSAEALFDLVGDAHFVLIGEASHGTREFYAARANMTQRLIEERNAISTGLLESRKIKLINELVWTVPLSRFLWHNPREGNTPGSRNDVKGLARPSLGAHQRCMFVERS